MLVLMLTVVWCLEWSSAVYSHRVCHSSVIVSRQQRSTQSVLTVGRFLGSSPGGSKCPFLLLLMVKRICIQCI